MEVLVVLYGFCLLFSRTDSCGVEDRTSKLKEEDSANFRWAQLVLDGLQSLLFSLQKKVYKMDLSFGPKRNLGTN